MRWPSLRPVQEDAIHEILGGEADVLISAQTAAGKTEAAFLPILSRMYENPAGSVQTLYVGPLKALINDQFRRLERLCQRAEIPVHRWHGDVDAGRRASDAQESQRRQPLVRQRLPSCRFYHECTKTRPAQFKRFTLGRSRR